MREVHNIEENIKHIAKTLTIENPIIELSLTGNHSHGDYTTNFAMRNFSKIKSKSESVESPFTLALFVKEQYEELNDPRIAKIEVVKPGFINFWLSLDAIISQIQEVLDSERTVIPTNYTNKRFMVEYAHPNTHKELHIGHMRTLITGESLSRLYEAQGIHVFRANYQGDIGPHVAKTLFGVKKLIKERNLSLETIETWESTEKAHFLGEAYVVGSKAYETNKEEIDALNTKLYQKLADIDSLYQQTRMWSLDYYDEFYTRFYTHFDKLFFESEMVDYGKEIVRKNIGKVFTDDNGTIIFPGETYGLHTRVFITKAGNPTYEGKEMGNAYREYEAFPFDRKVHVVGSEQAGYFEVVFKALELIDPEKFKDKQHHVPMGMVQLSSDGESRKISSRTGDILRVDWLIDQVKQKVESLISSGRIATSEKDTLIDQITIGAIKYSVLKVGTTQNVTFDIEKSVSLEGDSGPYIQYTYARCQSILKKQTADTNLEGNAFVKTMIGDEEQLLRLLYRFPDIVEKAGNEYAPNILCVYLFELSHKFNFFYQKYPILKGENREIRIFLTKAVGKVLQEGLYLLGIQAPSRM